MEKKRPQPNAMESITKIPHQRRNNRKTGIKTFEQSCEDFWANIDSNNLDNPLLCWKWTGRLRNKDGYGGIHFQGKMIGAHRASYIVHFGAIPEGLCVCHRCDNPICVNPNHLFLGTRKENGEDMARKGRAGGFKKKPLRAERQPFSKLTWDQVEEIRQSTLPQSKLAAIHGVTQTNISSIKTRKTWVRP